MGRVDSPARRFADLVELQDQPRLVVANADIDGIVSAQMLCSVTGWRIHALIDRQGNVRVHPRAADPGTILNSGRAFGVDVFSPKFPGVSNHPVHFGPNTRGPQAGKQALFQFDQAIDAAMAEHSHVNLSSWVHISAMGGSSNPKGMPYKYPLGTAQTMLALLEVSGNQPRLYDRQYLPWLVANCDGGLETIRKYAWNAEGWWSALAASVGPSSLSEALYRLATEQRPSAFTDVDRRLRYDEPERAKALNTKWNLIDGTTQTLQSVVSLISDLSGWADPFEGGVADLDQWTVTRPTARALPLRGILSADVEIVGAHLDAARRAIHMNFSVFRERGTALGWMLPSVDNQLERTIGAEFSEEEVPDDEPSIVDVE